MPGRVDLASFGEFRAGILRHIGMEERVVFPAARRARGFKLAIEAGLRADHGAIAALLVPSPTVARVAQIRSFLEAHNRREEQPGGAYDACDSAVGAAEAERLVQELRGFPDVPLKPYRDGEAVLRHIEATLELARRQWLERAGGP